MYLKGIFNCFTVPRTNNTIYGAHAVKYVDECLTEFYDVPSEIFKDSENKYKFRWSERFKEKVKVGPGPTDYCPLDKENKVMIKPPMKRKQPLFFYPSTTVPVNETRYTHNKTFGPDPTRYDPDEVACPCSKKYAKDRALFDEK